MFKNRNLTRTIAISTVLIALTAVTATAAIGIPGFSIFDTITTFFGGTSTVPERIGAPEPMTIGVCDTAGPIEVEASLVGPGPTAYATLGAAFTAINAGTHTGTISVEVCGNTTETGTAAVNASGSGSASYSFILIRPVGGVARTITGAVSGNPLVNLNGADNVTINGINSGGDTLTIQNTDSGNTSGTSTIKFIGGATGNTITNSTILGSGSMAVGTNGGVFWFSTDSVTTAGNDNNTISNNNIGPAGANLPSKGIYCNGSGTTTAIGNSGNIINNNNIFDYFAVATTSAGVYAADGCNTWSITNNRFYQTTAKAWTAGSASQHSPIWLIGTSTTSGSQGLTITGNIIGYASNTQTGTYAISGTGTSGRFVGIFFNGSVSGATSTISNNTIAAVSMTGSTASGTSNSTPFSAIDFQEGVLVSNGNTIGSQSATGSLSFSTTTASATEVFGIYNFSSNTWTSNSNIIGGISVTNLGASGTFNIKALQANTGSGVTWTANSNVVGGTVANSIQLSATGTGSFVNGMVSVNAPTSMTSNTVRNLTTNIGTGTTTGASVIGININATSANHTLSQNTVFNLNNTNTTGADTVTGILFSSSTGTNLVERNLVYGITNASNSASAIANGIAGNGGTATYRNNMIAIGAGIANAIQVNGILEPSGTDNFFHNSVYVGGSPTAGSSNSFAFNTSVTTNTRSFRDNIFFNARSNSGATSKNYAVQVGGTAANPSGLTLNNNVYFANGTGGVFGRFNTADFANLGAWKTAVGLDAASYEGNPQYIDPTNATPDLHIHATNPTPVEASGADVGVTLDYDGQTRSGLTPVDIGADAGSFVTSFATNDVQATAFIDPTNGATKITTGFAPQASFTNNGTAAQTNVPVRYRFCTDGTCTTELYNQTATIASLASGASATVTFPSTGAIIAGTHTTKAKAELVGDTVSANDEITGTVVVKAPLSGTVAVCSSCTYTSITNAGGLFEAINAVGLSADLTVEITGDISGELGTNALNTIASGKKVTIYPTGGPGTIRNITGSSANGLITLNGADDVIIDGSLNAADAGDRSLTITNTNTGTSSAVIWLQNGANSNRILSLNVVGNSNTTTLFGIGSGSSTIGITSAATNISNRIEGNSVSKTQYGIYSGGLSTVTKNTGNRINSNLLNTASPNNIAIGGILANFEDGIKIAHNNIGSIDKTALTGTAFGIALGLIPSNTVTTFTGSDVINADVSGNIINGITQMNSTGYSAFGIVLNTVASGTSLISNNMISQVRSAATPSDFSAGIVAGGGAGSTTQIYANSVAMTGTRGAATNPSYALAVGGSNPTIDIRNNILLNTQTSSSTGKSYAIGLAYSTYTALTSDNNDLFTSAAATLGQTGGLGTAGTDRTFATWLSTTGKDANSKNVDPQFKSTADIATSDLHLKRTPLSPSPVENFGVSIAANTGDYDEDTRSLTPDIGADEVTTFQLDAATYNTAENVTPATITVTRTGGSGNAGTVQYATSAAGGTTVGTCGSGGADYQQATGTLNFAAAETSKTFDIVICNDAVVETNEDVNITLSNATGSILGAQSTAVLTITNDDAASTNALLSDISLTNPTTAIAPPFAPGTAIYNASVANAVSSITVTGTAQDPNGSVSVNGGAFAVGSAFASVPLSVGANSVTVIGKAQDGTTQVSYTVNITRAVPAPTITSLSPASGWTDTTVIIVGTNFTGATAVSFGGTPATTFTVQTDGFISATAPAHAAGVVDVSVTGPGGTSANSANDDFTYVTPDSAPEVNFTNPANGATGVLISQPVGVGFSENVSLAANAITLECPSGNMILQYPPSPMASVAGVTFYPTMPGTTTCTVTVDASKVNDVDANDPPDFMAANYVFSFTTETPTTVASLTRAHPNPTNLASVIWTIEFAAAVDGVSTSNFALVQGGGVTGASITSVNPQGTNPNTKWNISVNTGSSSGTLGLNFVNGTGVTPSVSTTLPYPGEVYDIDRDTPATPTITGSTPTSPNNSSTTPTINGTAEADSFVKLYTSNDCTTGLLAGNFATGVNFAIGVTVTANTTTTIYASATDAAGNVSGCTATPFSYTHDTVAPDTSISSSPPATTTSTSATFEFGGSDSFAGRSEKPDAPNAVGFTFECERDGGGFASCTSPKNYTGLSVGTHTFKVRATDPAGNTDATAAEFTWEIVTIPVQISVDTNAANETTPTVVTVTATADSAVSGNQTVTVAAAGTNITAGDYNFSSTTITIPDGGTTGSVTFTIVDDGVYEGSETAALTISNPSAGLTLGSPVGANVAITDNDTAPVISISNVSHNEGDSGTTTYIFDLTKTGATELNATGDFDTSGVTAIEGVCTNAGTDFLGLGGNFGFLPNETAKTFTISVCGDTTFEPDETFRIDLTNAANATYTGGAPAIFGTGTIVNDDSAATLGNYGDTPVALAGNATVTPSAPPANATNLVVSASTGYAGAFAGGLTINQTTGVVTVTDAHPAGTYTVTVNAFGDGSTATDTFVLTVSPGATCGQSSFDPAVNYTVGTNPNKVVTADVNLDGNPDMVVANGVSNNVSVLLGNGSGGFGTVANFAVGDGPNSIAVADLNLDGNPDIATANNQSANLSILFGNGSGVFGPATSVSAGNNPIGVVTADFNFDGKADLAAANSTDGNVSVFLGDGAGGFGAATNFGVGTNAIEVAVGDFNNDGNADVVTANNGSNNVSVLIGNGLGGFAAAANFSVGALPQSLAVGDINHDGKHDIVVTTTAALGASVLLGDGAGSFAAATSTDVGSNPTGVAISDVNLDGYPDLVVTNFTAPAPNVSVMLGNGAGAFGAQTLFGAGDNTRSVAAGDFNLDGKPDLAVANSGSGNVSVLLNVCAAPETDLTILKTDGGATVAAGGTVAYTLDYANNGTTPATGVVLTETVPLHSTFNSVLSDPSWSCTPDDNALSTCTLAIGSLAFGGSGSAVFAVDVESPILGGATQIDNTATIADDGTHGADVNLTNNTSSDSTPLNIPISFAINDVTANEGDAGPTSFTFTITKTGLNGQPTTITLQTCDVSATAPGDYTSLGSCIVVVRPSGAESTMVGGDTVTFAATDTSKEVTVLVVGDTVVEPDETFTLKMVTSTNGTFTDDEGLGTITNDDSLCTPPPPNMVAWFDGSGTAPTVENIGGSPDGALNTAVVGTGKVGPGLVFDGNGSVTAVDSPVWDVFNGPFTIDAWVNFNSPGGNQTIISHNDGPGNQNKWVFALVGTQLELHRNDPVNGPISLTVPFTPVASQWYHVAVTRDGNTFTFYIDGVPAGTVTNGATPGPNASTALTIGSSEGGFFFNGRIDEVEIFSRALDVTEIAAIANAGSAGKCHTSTVRFAQATDSVTEDGAVTFTAIRDGANDSAVTVNYLFNNGGTDTATGGAACGGAVDYIDGNDQFSFGAGVSSIPFAVDTCPDAAIEGNETFSLTLANPSSGLSVVAPATETVTIVDDDFAPTQDTDVTLSGSALTIEDVNGANTSDDLRLSCNGANLRINDPTHLLYAGAGTQIDPNTVEVPLAGLTSILVNSLAGNDALTVDLSGCDIVPSGGITYNGGDPTSGTGDRLNIVGGNQGQVTYHYTNASDGNVQMQNFGTVNYTGLEPISNTGTASDVIFELPTGGTAATLGDDGTGGNGMSRLSGASFEDTDFANPTSSVTIKRGDAADTLAVNALPDLNSSLNIGTSVNTFSTIAFNGAVTLASGNSLAGFAAGTISFPNITSDVATSGTGTIALTTATNLTMLSGSSLTTVDGALTINANQQVTPTAGNFNGININAATVQSTGSGVVTVNGKGGTVGGGQHGVLVISGGVIRGGNAAGITTNVNGTGGAATGVTNIGVVVIDGGASITSIGGNVSVLGTGGSGTGGDHHGVRVFNAASAASISAGSSGTVTVSGTGGSAATGGCFGVDVRTAGAAITSNGGAVSVTGQGGACAENSGIVVTNASIQSGTNGPVSVTGTGGTSTGTNNDGINMNGGNISATGTGTVTVEGTATFGASSEGIHLSGGSPSITTALNSAITMIGDSMNLGAGSINSGTGPVTIRQKTANVAINLGTAGDPSAGPLNLLDAELDRVTAGTVFVGNSASGQITTTAAITHPNNLTLTTGAGITFGASSPVTMALDKTLTGNASGTATGAITVNAALGSTGTGGVLLTTARNIAVTAGISTVNGPITLNANQQVTPTAGTFFGINLDGAAAIVQASGTGVVTVNGRGGNSGNSIGIGMANSSVVKGGSTFGATTTSLTGTGGTGNNTHGLQIGAGASISSFGGNISVIGTAGTGDSAGQNIGFILYPTGTISSTVNGSVTVAGTGGTGGNLNEGIRIDGSLSKISAAGSGNVTVTATAGANSSNGLDLSRSGSISTGGGTIQITGTHGSTGGTGIWLNPGSSGNPIVSTLSNATITLVADRMDFAAGSVSANAGIVNIRQKTNAQQINLGGADSATQLGLTDAELDRVTAGTMNIGDAFTGAVSVSSAITQTKLTNIFSTGTTVLTGGDLGIFGTVNSTLAANSGGIVRPGASPGVINSGDLNLASGSTYAVEIGGTIPGNGAGRHDQLNVTGTVTLGGNLTLAQSGGFIPANGNTFVIINNDLGDLVSGTFNGLVEGATIPNFIGTGRDAKISYVGGDGNDVVLTAQAAPGTLQFASATYSGAENGGSIALSVTRTGGTDGAVSADYTLAGGSATGGAVCGGAVDYVNTGGTVNFTAGSSSPQTINVQICPDATLEPDELFTVTLSNGNIGTPASANVTILNDECSTAPGGMVSWWPGETDGTDIRGTNNGSETSGITHVAGKVGNAFSTNGTTGTVSVPSAANLQFNQTTPFSIDAWTKFSVAGGPGKEAAIITKWGLGTGQMGYSLRTVSSTGAFAFMLDQNGGPRSQAIGTTIPAADTWYHVTGTFDGSSLKIYVNGVLEATTANTSVGFAVGTPFDIGVASVFPDTANVPRLIDEVEVFNRALSDTEVTDLYNSSVGGKCRVSDLSVTVAPVSYTVYSGNDVNYVATVANTGSVKNSNVVMTFPIDPNFTFGSASAGCSPSGSNVICNAASVPVGGSINFAIRLTANTVVATTPTSVNITVTGTEPDNNLPNNTFAVSTTIEPIACLTPPANMVSWWTGQTDGADIWGTNNGTELNVTHVAGKVGTAFNIAATNSRVSVPSAANLQFNQSTPFSIDAWTKLASAGGPGQEVALVTKWGLGTGQMGYSLRTVASTGAFAFMLDQNGGPRSQAVGTTIPAANTWYHVTGTFDGTSLKIYVNGVLEGTVANTSVGVVTSTPFDIGVPSVFADSGTMARVIDEVEVFNRALTATEVTNLYNASNAGKCHISTIQLSSAAYSVTEGDVNAPITVTRVGAHDTTATFNFATSAGTATAGPAADYDAVSITGVTFAAGEVSKVVNIPIHDDAIYEVAETVNIAVSNVATAPATTPGTPLTAVLTIDPDGDAAPVLDVFDATFAGDNLNTSGCTNAFEVRLTGNTEVYPVTVHYQTSNDSATAGQDYAATSGTLTFNNSIPQCIPVTILEDPVNEPTEQFFIDLDTPTNATIGDGRGIGTIPSGDPLSFTISDVTQVETNSGTTNFVFNVAKVGTTSQPSQVTISTVNGSAVGGASCGAGVDFVSQSGSVLNFLATDASLPFTVTVCGDSDFEGDEAFTLSATATVGASATTVAGTKTGTILNDDCTPPPSGMVAWYPGQTNATDIVGTNNGTETAVTHVTGRVGQAFSFNGSSKVEAPPTSVADITASGFTVDFWMQAGTQTGGDATLIEKSQNANSGWAFQADSSSDGKMRFAIGNGSSYPEISSDASVLDNQFHHITGTWNSTDNTMRLYIDGVLQTQTATNASPANNTDTLNFGYLKFGNTRYYSGLLDEVEIFNRALTAGEIANLAMASGGGKCHTPIVQFARSTEMEDESQTAAVIVNRSVSTSGLTDVTAATVAGGTATGGAACTAGVDYKTTSQLLSFGNGDVGQTMSIEICPDLEYETPQTIKLQLSGPSGAAVLGGNSEIFLTINDTATQFTNNHDPINIPAFGATASPYPSTINVSGAPTVNGGMRVTLYDVELANPDNLDILLVGPLGQKMVIMGDAGGSTSMSGPVTLTFDDSAGQVLPNGGPLTTGKFEPTTWEPVIAAFPATAPAFPYVIPGSAFGGPPSLASGFGAGNPNGQWRLFVRDDAGAAFTEAGQPGAIAGGWGLQFLVPTASGVSVSGRVTTAEGRGIRGAIVTVTGNSLATPINVMTGVNGRYIVEGLTAGETYIVTIRSRRFVFSNSSRIVTLNDNVNDADFVADRGTTRSDQ